MFAAGPKARVDHSPGQARNERRPGLHAPSRSEPRSGRHKALKGGECDLHDGRVPSFDTHGTCPFLCYALSGHCVCRVLNPGRRSFLACPGLWSTRAFGPKRHDGTPEAGYGIDSITGTHSKHPPGTPPKPDLQFGPRCALLQGEVFMHSSAHAESVRTRCRRCGAERPPGGGAPFSWERSSAAAPGGSAHGLRAPGGS